MRRTRIKGIANIPQRKKVEPLNNSDGDIQPDILKSLEGIDKNNGKINELNSTSKSIETEKTILYDITPKVSKSDSEKIDINPINYVADKMNEPPPTAKKCISVLGNVLLKSESKVSKSNSEKIQGDSVVSIVKNDCNEPEKKPTLLRRRAIKPSIAIRAISRRSDLKTSNGSDNVDTEQISNYKDSAGFKAEKDCNDIELSEQIVSNVQQSTACIPVHGLSGRIDLKTSNDTVHMDTEHTTSYNDATDEKHVIDIKLLEQKDKQVGSSTVNISVHTISRSDLKTSNDSENDNTDTATNYKEAPEVEVEKHANLRKLSEQRGGNVGLPAANIDLQSNCSYSNNQVILDELRNVKSPVQNPLEMKIPSTQHMSAGSDCEYPPPPPSPSKLNRSRIKAIPKIRNRKISFSASESEDESKKLDHRIRHDSQSSNLSATHESVTEQPVTPKVLEFSSVIQRKCKRTEWSRKLAEARREFTRKFMTGKPDHKKLTMIDLIFYNPTTNAMKNERNKNSEADSKTDPTNEEEVDNPLESADDPTNKDDEVSKMSDEENEIPAPQIKIGPSGEIILDEKSLVIENKQTKIDREKLQRSQVIDGNGDRPYGVFKKVKRSKDWSHSETLRFYRALSTIGTDFTLMCELFPNRTRRELKMKFKKEEKINQALVDKAVMEPCSFDFEELKKEFELVEIERKEIMKQVMEEQKLKKTKGIKKSIKFLKVTQENDENKQKSTSDTIRTESDGECQQVFKNNSLVDIELSNSYGLRKKQTKPKITNHMKTFQRKNFDTLSGLSDSDSASGDSGESEVVWKPVQTRYGRKIRKRQIYEPEAKLQEEIIVPRKIQKPNLGNEEEPQKPGSLMMISSKAPDGQPVVQIFMVTDKEMPNGKQIQGVEDINTQNLLPIAMIQTGHTDDEVEDIVENNYTIPAETENKNLTQMVDSVEVDIVENVENKIDGSIKT